jgi:hypothetical protein
VQQVFYGVSLTLFFMKQFSRLLRFLKFVLLPVLALLWIIGWVLAFSETNSSQMNNQKDNIYLRGSQDVKAKKEKPQLIMLK